MKFFDWLEDKMPKLVLAPSAMITLVFVYGFIAWTTWISFTKSRFVPKYDIIGNAQYTKLWANDRWTVSFENLLIFSFLFIAIALLLGVILAVFLDQKIRAEGAIRTIFLYPMALSMIVTGVVWKWIMNPGLGLEKAMHDLGWTSFEFRWLIESDMAIYTIVIASVWQSSGFVMALFLAGLRGVNSEIIKAAMLEGASLFKVYTRIIIPSLRPVFISSIVVLAHLSIKSFDMVVALTAGGPGYSSNLPANYMFEMAFGRGDLGQAATSAVMMLVVLMAVIVPYLYSELRQKGS